MLKTSAQVAAVITALAGAEAVSSAQPASNLASASIQSTYTNNNNPLFAEMRSGSANIPALLTNAWGQKLVSDFLYQVSGDTNDVNSTVAALKAVAGAGRSFHENIGTALSKLVFWSTNQDIRLNALDAIAKTQPASPSNNDTCVTAIQTSWARLTDAERRQVVQQALATLVMTGMDPAFFATASSKEKGIDNCISAAAAALNNPAMTDAAKGLLLHSDQTRALEFYDKYSLVR